jgi:hypothetical protein
MDVEAEGGENAEDSLQVRGPLAVLEFADQAWGHLGDPGQIRLS